MTLLELGLLRLRCDLVILVELLVLLDLLLQLCASCFEGGLLQELGFLVEIDLALGDQLVQCLVGVFGNNVIDLGGIGLGENS